MSGRLVFTGTTDDDRTALWSSDGTAAGTVLLRPPGSGTFSFQGTAGGLLYFAVSGSQLWKTDGTVAGTALVETIVSGSYEPALSSGSQRFPAVGDQLFFRAFTQETGFELWVTDGTETGTHLVEDLAPGQGSTYPYSFAVLDGELLFLSSSGKLWKTDGTEAGTIPLAPEPPSASVYFYELTTAGDQVFFRGNDPVAGLELWKSDGTAAGTGRVADIAPGLLGSLSPNHSGFFTGLGNRVLFFANDNTTGEEPWSSDGTQAGTVPLGDLNPGADGSFYPLSVRNDRGIVVGGLWYFRAFTSPEGWALWKTDGTAAGTQVVRRFPPLRSSMRWSPSVDHEGTLFFGVNDNDVESLWKSDGSAAGTSRVKVLGEAILTPEIASWNGHLYYVPVGKDELWKSDGTEAGTQMFTATPGSSTIPLFLTPAASGFFYVGWPGAFSSFELWFFDDTPAGSQRLFSTSTDVGRPTAFRNGIAFARSDLWLSDGTMAGTAPVGSSARLTDYQFLTAAGDKIFFWAYVPGLSAYEPWVSDGTAAGTRMLRDIRPGFAGSLVDTSYSPVAALGHLWFFLADDGVTGEELWVSDGTTPGTRRVRDIRPGAEPARIETLVAGRNRVWFAADDGVHGKELWMSDGTEAGTRMVRDIVPGTDPSGPQELAPIGHVLLFSAFDPDHGVELWRTDGTEAGTVRLQDIAPGPLPSSPSEITASGPYVYFSANDGTTGFEPWALDRTLLGGFLTATKTVSGQPVPGGTLTYTIVISNVGAGPHPDRPGDELVDVLPAGLALTGASADAGSVTTDLPGNRVAWNGALGVGGTATVTIEATVTASRGTVLRNQASLSFDANGDGAHESAAVSQTSDVLITSGPLSFYAISPCRVLDTRTGTPLTSGAVRTVPVAGACGIPADAEAVAANLIAVAPSGQGSIALWPAGAPAPGTSNINFAAGVTRANNATLPLNGAGSVDVRATLFGTSPQVHLVLDISGYYRLED